MNFSIQNVHMKLIGQATHQFPAIVGNEGKGLGGFANLIGGQLDNPGKTTATIISNIIGFLTIVAGLWFLIQFMLGAVTWISAGGDKGKVKEAKDKITQSVIGLAIVVAAYAIAGLVSNILGLNFLDIGGALKLITP
jgi:hypothetical protein